MVRKSFIKSLNDEEMTLWETVVEYICYNPVVICLRKIGRFLLRLPRWLVVCWKTEAWDYEGIYYFLGMFLKDLHKAQKEDTWHVEHETKRRAQQIELVLAHLDRYMNWFDYYKWPEAIHTQNLDGTYSITYAPEDEKQCEYVHKMEEKHFNKFWDLLKKWHTGWWT